jgi:hypothetical protein
MTSGIPVREWAPDMAEDPRVLDTAIDLLAEQGKRASRGR